MRFKSLFATVLSLSLSVNAQGNDCGEIYAAGLGRIGDDLIRYSVYFDSACIYIENLIPGAAGQSTVKKKICRLNDKDVNDDFASVEFMGAEFVYDMLNLKYRVTSYDAPDAENVWCRVLFVNRVAERLVCSDT